MKKWIVSCSAIAALTLSLSAAADCIYPKAPEKTPDGKTASEAEMVEGMKALKKFDTEVNAYTACLEQETSARISEGSQQLQPDQVQQIKAIQSKRHNAAVDDLQAHAAQFNEQVRVYKARSKS